MTGDHLQMEVWDVLSSFCPVGEGQVHRWGEGGADIAADARGQGEHLCAFLGVKLGECVDVSSGDHQAVTLGDGMRVQERESQSALGHDMGAGAAVHDLAEGAGCLHCLSLGVLTEDVN